MHEHHTHPVNQMNRAFKIGILLNVLFVLLEGAFGIATNSLSLLADAGHNLSDVLGLVVSWIAVLLSARASDNIRTYGYKRTSILAALFNAVFLLIAIGAIIVEAIERIQNPQPIAENSVIVVAAIGILVNGVTALLFMKGQKRDLNIKGAFLHMAADALVSVGVVLAAIVVKFTGWYWLDPFVSLAIALVIFVGTWNLLKDSLALSIDEVPKSVNLQEVKNFILAQPSVVEIHDMHIWALSTTENALTVHISRNTLADHNQFIQELDHQLTTKFDLSHITIQIELGRIADESVDHSI